MHRAIPQIVVLTVVSLASTRVSSIAESNPSYKDRAISYRACQNWSKAEEQLTRYLALCPSDLEARAYRADCYVHLSAFAKACADYDQLVDSLPKDGILRCGRANIHYFMGDYQAALSDFEASEKLGLVLDAPTQLRLADCYWHGGRQADALRLFDLLKSSNLTQVSDWLQLAQRFHQCSRYSDQAHCLNLARQRAKNSNEFNFQRASFALDSHDYASASDTLHHLLSGKEHLPFAYSGLAECSLQQNRCAESIARATCALKLDRHCRLAYEIRGRAYEKSGQLRKALEDYAHWQKLDPYNVVPLNAESLVFLAMKQYRQAIETCSAALALDPECSVAYGIRASALAEASRYDSTLAAKAFADFNKALSLSPGNFRSHLDLGKLLYRQLRSDEALVQFDKCLQLHPTSREAQHWRSLAQRDIDRK